MLLPDFLSESLGSPPIVPSAKVKNKQTKNLRLVLLVFFQTDALCSLLFLFLQRNRGEMLRLFRDLFSLAQEAVIEALMSICGSRTGCVEPQPK